MDILTDLTVETEAKTYSNLNNFMNSIVLLSPTAPPLLLSVMLGVVRMNMKIK